MQHRVGRREHERYDVAVAGHLRTGRGKELAAKVTDLSESGCSCVAGSMWINEGANISVRIGSLGPIEATVRWVEGYEVGMEFHRPIYGPVFEHLCEMINQAEARKDRRIKPVGS
ncbi:PilZ domain-containing protein [Qipengyuania sp. MTN3-11]|uniref:PilZ domain-containing protein n=1 Tax=Qipengyuania sp. MTN3-11 TaxID=3056557 RepID=UPI0036F40C18